MNVINKLKLKLNVLYPELNDLNIDDEILEQIISNKNFKTQYKTNIKPFIKYLREYKYSEYDNGTFYHLHTLFYTLISLSFCISILILITNFSCDYA